MNLNSNYNERQNGIPSNTNQNPVFNTFGTISSPTNNSNTNNYNTINQGYNRLPGAISDLENREGHGINSNNSHSSQDFINKNNLHQHGGGGYGVTTSFDFREKEFLM